MRLAEIAEIGHLGHLIPQSRRFAAEIVVGSKPFGADGVGGLNIILDDGMQNFAFPAVKRHRILHCLKSLQIKYMLAYPCLSSMGHFWIGSKDGEDFEYGTELLCCRTPTRNIPVSTRLTSSSRIARHLGCHAESGDEGDHPRKRRPIM